MNETDPHYHTSRIRRDLEELIEHLKKDAMIVQEPAARILFKTAAEVLLGLREACRQYDDTMKNLPQPAAVEAESDEDDSIGVATDGAPD